MDRVNAVVFKRNSLTGERRGFNHAGVKKGVNSCAQVVEKVSWFYVKIAQFKGKKMGKHLAGVWCASVMALWACSVPAQVPNGSPLAGDGAKIAFYGEGTCDIFKKGAVLFTDRNYTVKECPAWLEGRKFLRGSIESGCLRITGDGVLTLLTPEPVHPRAATQ